ADGAGRLAADRGRQRRGAVDQDLALGQGPLEIGERLRLGAKRNGEEDDRTAGGRIGVAESLDVGIRHRLPDLPGGLLGALRLTRADDDQLPGARPADREAVAQRPGAADDRYRLRHRPATYRALDGLHE